MTLAIVFGGLFHLLVAMMAGESKPPEFADHPDALWHVVHDLCVTDKRLSGFAAPCLSVDLENGFAIVPDPSRATQILFVPTRRLAGIESPGLLAPGAPNYWRLAWNARGQLDARAHRVLARDEVGLAINSATGRTQDQLHIHVDCIRPAVRASLKAGQAHVTASWSTFPLPLAGHRYRAMRILGADLGGQDPFKLLAARNAQTRAHMDIQTLAMTGAWFGGRPGFILLAAHRSAPDNLKAAAEDLLDHGCAVLHGH